MIVLLSLFGNHHENQGIMKSKGIVKSKDGRFPIHAMYFVAIFVALTQLSVGQLSAQNLAAPVSVVDPWSLDRLHSPILRHDLKIFGAQSCAAASCHGGPRPGALQPDVRRGAEFMLWLEDDPHAKSWRTMCGDTSQSILRRLNIIDPFGNVTDKAGFDNCLACHNSTQKYKPSSIAQATTHRPEGVGCSACHGPSERWIVTHDQFDFSPASATELGFVNAGDLYTRARMCASCHIGDKDRDMNHDIIAAGHPVLRYEFATYHNRLPKHWRDPESCDTTSFEPQLWFAGQVASADASLSLVQARASKSHSVSVWPELASYDCASCHHQLGFQSQRGVWGSGKKSRARFSSWNDSGLRWILSQRLETDTSISEDVELLAALDRLGDILSNATNPDRLQAAQAAQHARHVLRTWFDSVAGSTERSTMNVARLNQIIAHAAGRAETFESFESTSQYYLAAIASRCGWPGGPDGQPRTSANHLRHLLKQVAERNPESQISSANIRLAGIQLGGWLGPVRNVKIESPDETWQAKENDDGQQRLNELFREIQERWEERDAERAKQFETPPQQNEGQPSISNQPGVESAEDALKELNRPE